MREILVHYVDRLAAGDVDAIAELYTTDGRVEDPVGSPAHEGVDALRAFYAGTAGMLHAEIVGPICCAGNTGVMPLLGRLTLPGRPPRYLDAIDVVEFEDDGRIRSLRAYWDPTEMRATPDRG
jgi:steroid delta-isomerase